MSAKDGMNCSDRREKVFFALRHFPHCDSKRRLFRSAVLLLLGYLCSAHLPAAALPKQAFPQYVVTTLSSDQGGPEGRNTIIVQTRDGYLWTIMERSLVRFDGVRFTAFNSDNTPEIRTKFISSLLLDHRGGALDSNRQRPGTVQQWTLFPVHNSRWSFRQHCLADERRHGWQSVDWDGEGAGLFLRWTFSSVWRK